METLTLEDCKAFEADPSINPLTGRKIKIGGPMFLDLVEKCNELKRKHAVSLSSSGVKHTSTINIHDFKSIILSELDVLRRAEIAEKNFFKVRAYDKVIEGISRIDYPILKWEDVQHIEGIGAKISAKIKEIIRDGQLFRAQEIRKDPKQSVLERLMSVHGIGAVKAKQLYRLGIRSISDLRREVKQHPEWLNDVQHKGLKYVEDFEIRIPREEMAMHEKILQEATKGTAFHFDIVGSYRRGADSSGDIDVLLTLPNTVLHPTLKFGELITLLKDSGYLIDTLAEGGKKYMGVASLKGHTPRRIDLMLTPREEYAYALLYFTGSKNFNIRVRRAALEKGYSLNEYALTPIEESARNPPLFYREEDLLRFLIGEYVPPTERM